MSSSTLSSTSGLSDGINNSKRALSDSEEVEERSVKKTRMALNSDEQPNSKRDAKEKKKRQRKKKKKHSVVIVEDGRARVKDLRRGESSFLDTAEVESIAPPVQVGESSNTRSRSSIATTIPVDNVLKKDDVEQTAPSPKDKGKGKATDSQPPAVETQSSSESMEEKVARLVKELSCKNELIQQHQNAFNHVQQTITCQICLELMYKPYALSPCGHLACYDCLVSWFKAPPPDERPVLPPVPLRKKTCPHCRAVVTDRPAQVWGVKSIVGNFSKSGLLQGNFLSLDESAQNASDSADPWEGIFRKVVRGHGYDDLGYLDGAGILDDEDGGVYRCYDCMHEIWNGVCSNCGREYPDPNEEDEDFDFGHELGSEDEEFGHGLGWGGVLPGLDADEPINLGDAQLRALQEAWAADVLRDAGLRLPSENISDNEAEEDDYESSFIDDENDIPIRRATSRRAPIVIDITSESEDDEEQVRRGLPAIPRRRAHSSPLHPVEVSDDEDEIQEVQRPARSSQTGRRRGPLGAGSIVIVSDDDDEDTPGSSRNGNAQRGSGSRRSRTRNRVMSTDEDSDSDGIDPGLADRVATRERELYGDDGSVPRHREHEDGSRHFYSDDDGSRSEDSAYDNEYYSSQDDDRSNLFGW